MTPVQVRISGAPDDVIRLADFLAGLAQVSASPVALKQRGGGLAQGYLTVILTGNEQTEADL